MMSLIKLREREYQTYISISQILDNGFKKKKKIFRETGYEVLNQILLLSNGNFFKRIKFTDKNK